jgi:hypothetical protein
MAKKRAIFVLMLCLLLLLLTLLLLLLLLPLLLLLQQQQLSSCPFFINDNLNTAASIDFKFSNTEREILSIVMDFVNHLNNHYLFYK